MTFDSARASKGSRPCVHLCDLLPRFFFFTPVHEELARSLQRAKIWERERWSNGKAIRKHRVSERERERERPRITRTNTETRTLSWPLLSSEHLFFAQHFNQPSLLHRIKNVLYQQARVSFPQDFARQPYPPQLSPLRHRSGYTLLSVSSSCCERRPGSRPSKHRYSKAWPSSCTASTSTIGTFLPKLLRRRQLAQRCMRSVLHDVPLHQLT